MDWLSRSDAVLLAVAAYVAVMALVRLMRHRRDELVADVQKQYEAHRRQRKKLQRTAGNDDRSAA